MSTEFGEVGQQIKMSCHQIPGIIRSIECASVKLDNQHDTLSSRDFQHNGGLRAEYLVVIHNLSWSELTELWADLAWTTPLIL